MGCDISCETCQSSNDYHQKKCLKCNSSYPFEIPISNTSYKYCFKNCTYFHYLENNTFYCTLNFSCPEKYPLLIEDKLECINSSILDIFSTTISYQTTNNVLNYTEFNEKDNNDILNEIKNKINLNNNTEDESKYYDEILNVVDNYFSGNYDTSKIDKGEDDILTFEKMIITLTTTLNQKNDINKNMTSIDIGECENLLKKEYNLKENDQIYIKKIDVYQEGMQIPKVEYDIYYKDEMNILKQLNFTVCEKSKMFLLIPIEITDKLETLNSSSGYFNDICYSATSDDGTYITLKDRKKEYIDNNKMVCQEGCSFSEYNYTSKMAECTCDIQKKSSFKFSDMTINKTELYENMIDIKQFANINILKCYQNLFSKENISKNIAFFILIILIIVHIVFIIIFYKKQLLILNDKIKDIVKSLKSKQHEKKIIIMILIF